MYEAEKKAAAIEALNCLPEDAILGIGTGSTVSFFIEALSAHRHKIERIVSSSERSSQQLKALGFEVVDLNDVGSRLDLYVDGADEIDPMGRMIKGGGGALTQEKILIAAAKRFICIVDSSKCVSSLGAFPLPIEVIPSARGLVARKMIEKGGTPQLRENFKTDNHNLIIDVKNLDLSDPVKVEIELNQIPGVVTVGLFTQRKPDHVFGGHRPR